MATEKNKVKTGGARILPHNSEAEQSALACVFLDKNATFYIMEQLAPDDFYNEHNADIFDAMRRLFAAGIPVDFVTLTEELERCNMTAQVGGMTYISALTNALPSAANYRHYAAIIRRHSLMRRLIAAAGRIADAAFNPAEALDDDGDVLAYAEKQIFDIGENLSRGSMTHISLPLNEAIEHIDLIHRDRNALRGIPTGFAWLDYITNGLQRSDLILLAARPSVGKTALGMNIIQNIAMNGGRKDAEGKVNNYRCAVFSLEMSARQLTQRMLCGAAGVSMSYSLSGKLKKDDFQRLWITKGELGKAEIYIDDSSLITPIEILSKCRRLKREKGLDVVLIDYLQLMYSGNRKPENRQTEIAEITRRLKIAAKELDVPVILLSQLNRDVEKRGNKRPQLSDLRESGAIEQDADIVMFLNRKHDKDDTSVPEWQRNMIELTIAKHRNGETGTSLLEWHGETVTFKDVQPGQEPEGKEVKA